MGKLKSLRDSVRKSRDIWMIPELLQISSSTIINMTYKSVNYGEVATELKASSTTV